MTTLSMICLFCGQIYFREFISVKRLIRKKKTDNTCKVLFICINSAKQSSNIPQLFSAKPLYKAQIVCQNIKNSRRYDVMSTNKQPIGYLPDERPPFLELILFALLQIVVMFPEQYFNTITANIFNLPTFTFPTPSLAALAALMPIAIATIPESTAHIYQLDIYVNNLAKKRGAKRYDIEDKLGLNLIGDGVGDIVSGLIGGPAGTNYGENISAMAISKIFSVPVLIAASIITMVISCFTPLINAVYSIPTPVIGGLSIYLFGIIAAQGITIMMDRKVDMFKSKNLAIIATILIIGLGGSFGYPNGMIPVFGIEFPAIATAAVFGIVLNLLLSIGEKPEAKE